MWKDSWKWLFVVLALAGIAFSVVRAEKNTAPVPIPPPYQEPVRNPYLKGISGAGVVEPASESVVVGVSDPGMITKIFVTKGQYVKTGEPLFILDTRVLEAQLTAARGALGSAEGELQRVISYRRKEEEPGLRAKLAQAESVREEAKSTTTQSQSIVAENETSIRDLEDQLQRQEATAKAAATPEEQMIRIRYQLELSKAKLATSKIAIELNRAKEKTATTIRDQAQADLNVYLAGPWEADVKKAQADVAQSKSQVDSLIEQIERHTVRAPIDGEVIRMNLHLGEYALADGAKPEDAPVVLGRLNPLHIRVDIDEFDVPHYEPGMPATAFLKVGEPQPIKLEFVLVEPFIVPKRQLTNSQQELVDTRVLQAVYKVVNSPSTLYVGEQVDVFIDAAKKTATP